MVNCHYHCKLLRISASSPEEEINGCLKFTESSSDDDFFLLNYTTMGDKIVNTILVKQGNFGEQNNPHPSPPFKVGVIFVFYTIAGTAVQHCKQGMGEGKLHCSFWSWQCQKSPLAQSFSTNFVAIVATPFYHCLVLVQCGPHNRR